MKFRASHICIPVALFENTQLTPLQKWIMLYIDALPQDAGGAVLRDGAIATALGIKKKEAKAQLSELRKRGALSFTTDEDGLRKCKAYLYKTDYALEEEREIEENADSESGQIDYGYIMEQWNTINPALPQLMRMTPQRKAKTRTCLQKNGLTVAGLVKVFQIVAASSFLQHGKDGTWSADFDWIVRDNKGQVQKILEGGFSKGYNERNSYEEIMRCVEKHAVESEYQ